MKHSNTGTFMRRFFQILLCLIAVVIGAVPANAFVLVGPDAQYPGVPAGFGDSWQTPDIAYNPYIGYDTLQIGPKNIGEEYRRNTPVMYYTLDANFLDF